MALSEKAKNPFEGGDLQANIREEKGKVLALLAQYGTEGYRIYDDARQSLQDHETNTTGKLDSGRFAPVATLKSLAGRHNQALDAAIKAVADLRESEGEFFDATKASTGRTMDMALEDRSGQLQFDRRQELFESQTREQEANLREYDLRAIRPETSSSGGGGGGRSGGGGFVNSGPTTLPLGLLGNNLGAPLDLFDAARSIGGSFGQRAPTRGSGGSRSLTTPSRSSGSWKKPSSGQTASKKYSSSPSTWRGL